MLRFTPYEGTKPYAFISYARVDTKIMLESIQHVREKKYRLWYDEGIPGGNDWPSYIAEHLKKSGAVIFYLSCASLISPNCYSEMMAANQQKKKVVCVLLDDSARLIYRAILDKRALTLQEEQTIKADTRALAEKRSSSTKIPEPGEWVEGLQDTLFIDEGQDAERIAEKILETHVLTDAFKGSYEGGSTGKSGRNGWIAAIIALLIVLSGLSVLGIRIYTSYTAPIEETPEPVAEETAPKVDVSDIPGINEKIDFKNETQIERAVRSLLGKSEGEITVSEVQSITSLSICGKTHLKSSKDIVYEDGNFYVNGVKMAKGEIQNLSIIQKMYYLSELTLVNQNISNINRLKELPILSSLNLAGNPLTSISLDGGFTQLQELNISHTGITSLEGINAPKLKKIYVSADMLPLNMNATATYEVVLVK